MSKINRIRILNLNYNGNTVRIDDETFHLNGESTLLSLRNGGGKTVLVQMIIALFVNNSYRNVGDREFKSYFTTSQPSFIMTEWCLDQGQGYFLAGMMVRKCQNPEENNQEDLELFTFTGFYKNACEYDLEHLPVIEETKGKRILKGFGACKKELEELKKNNREFFYYDMSQPYQRRMYFAKLLEYQINHKEWETIIKKVNSKESGLSELFANAKDEKGLVEKWILTAIEGKLNQQNDRIQEFRTLAYKLIRSYRENETKIRRKEIIEAYFTDAEIMHGQIAEYEKAEYARNRQRSRIARFILDTDRIFEEFGQQLVSEKNKEEQLFCQLRRIEHEECSYQIYQYEDEKQELLLDRIDSEERINRCVHIKKEAKKELCRFQCAGLYREAMDFEREISKLQEQITVLMSKQQDSEKERKRLGSMLYWYYFKHIQECDQKITDKTEQITKKEQERKENTEEIQKQIAAEKEMIKKIGALSALLKDYDRVEEKFNQHFSAGFARNIVGEYEEGFLELHEKKFQDELTAFCADVIRLTERSQTLKNEEKLLNGKKEKNMVDMLQCKTDLQNVQMHLKELNEEKARRKLIMQHILAPEQELNQRVLLLERLERKMAELEMARDEYKNKAILTQKEYENLKQGVVMELPEHILAFLEEQNIESVYGMAWLKKNGRSVLENQKLVEINPFLPYCIILNQSDLEKLRGVTEIYTNFPIPIILREHLEETLSEQGDALICIGNIRFFVMFNKHLLQPEELEKLLSEKKKEWDGWLEKAERKSEEMKQYRSYYTELEDQKFSFELVAELTKTKEKKEQEYQQLEKAEEEYRQKRKENTASQEETARETELAKEKKRKAEQRRDEYAELVHAYKEYEENRRERERFQRRLKETENRECMLKEKQKEIEEVLIYLKNEENEQKKELETYQNQMVPFLSYKEEIRPDFGTDFEPVKVQARYRAITEGISASLKDLNENLAKEEERRERKEKELKKKNKYDFQAEEYQNIIHSEEQEQHLEKTIEKAEREENAAREAQVKLEKNMTRIETRLEDIKRRLREQTGSVDLIDRKQITDTDFAARKKLTEYERGKREKRIQELYKRCHTFENVKAAMAEYTDYTVMEGEEEQESVTEQISGEELVQISGNLRRELKQKEKQWEYEQQKTEKLIRDCSEKESYQEDFFKKGFENLLALVANVADIKLQLDTLTASYDSSLKKLQVDLLSIDKERKNLEELFLEYVRDIDEHMHRIDKNSTIPVRGKALKMLKLEVPDWENNKEMYQAKLRDFTENYIQRGLKAVEENENAQELLGKLITTKRIYDEIVGIGNIGIRLYKIEAEREVAISWQEVSANSGGEGFLSAFVILSCLLSYMRRDENDLFAGNGEGKVLIMDNPFAQTNAVHLLKPMMDMAKRTNTQLICLSGLGGDSIYNRFDNIYVLNLVSANLRRIQYLKGEHLKGEEFSNVVLSQFQMEQETLF